MTKRKTPWSVFIGIILGIFVGAYVGETKGLFGITFFSAFDLIGTLFLNALTLVVVPLVSSSIITGIARIGNDADFKRLGTKTFTFYFSTSILAILTGLLFVNLIQPGVLHTGLTHTLSKELLPEVISFKEIVKQIVPSNIINAFAQGQMLGLIFFSLIFGYALSKSESQGSLTQKNFWQGIFDAMIRITQMLMRLLPIGVFCLVAKVFATTGLESLEKVGLFFLTSLLSLATFTLIVLPLLLKFIGKVSPWRHFRAMGPALVTAFSTSSSSATLPVTIDCVEKRAGVSNRICSLVVPLGTSVNMSGSALYECVAAMFVAQAYGIDLSFGTQFLIVLMSLITSIGVAGVPSSSLVAIIIILKTLGLPSEGIGLFIAVDRLLDMCRTTVNVFSDSCCAVLVARSEGEKNVLQPE